MLSGRTSPVPRRQRNDFQPAAGLYRARHPQPPSRGRDARPRQPQQAVDPRDRRRQHAGIDTRHRRALGTGVRHCRRGRILHPDLSYRVRLRRAGRRRQYSRRQDRRPRRRQADHDHLFSRRCIGRPGRNGRSRRGAGPHQRNLAAGYGFTGILVAFLARKIRWRSFRSPSCSAESAPAAGCCSAGSACPTPRSRFCRASSSCSCSRAMRCTAGSVF